MSQEVHDTGALDGIDQALLNEMQDRFPLVREPFAELAARTGTDETGVIARLEATWSVSTLPLGRGRVKTAHGWIPMPAPATAKLLTGFEFLDDGIDGERVTPTGAAILSHLGARQDTDGVRRRLRANGCGFGTRRFPGLSNVLRLMAFEETAPESTGTDRVSMTTRAIAQPAATIISGTFE